MDRMQLLATLLEREEQRRDAARLAWQQGRQQLDAASQQRQDLLGYREDYHRRWTTQFRQGGTMEILRCYQGFVERLDQAVTAQQGQVLQAEQRLGRLTDQLRQRETRVAMVRKLIERRTAQARQVAERREQKQADEAAMRMGRARESALHPLNA